MRRILWLLMSLATLSCAAQADTTWVADSLISGSWTAAHSPYMIQANVHVPAGNGLAIGPGVTVFFTGHYSLTVDSLAFFSAIGTARDSVRFTTDTLAYPDRWEGIVTHYVQDTVRMEYCLVECAHCTTWASSTVCFHRTRVIVGHSTFRRTIAGAIRFFGGWIDLSDSYFTGNLDWDGSSFDIYGPCPGHITNCLFEHNHAMNDGGAMDIGNSSLQDTVFVTGCTFRKNVAGAHGGGFQNEGGLVILTDCLFDDNHAGHGGAISGVASTTIVNQCTLIYNSSDNEGGGIDIVDGGSAQITMTECLISNNVAATYGGGLSDVADNSLVERCVFDNNSALNGGAVSINRWYQASPIIRNCTIVRNSARAQGSAVCNDALGHPTLINDIFAFNGSGRAISHPPSGAPQLHNCTFFGNADGNFYMASDTLRYSLLVYSDPRFVNLVSGDFHLTSRSPCIDAGWSNSPRDPDGTIADIGAFYYDQRLKSDPTIVLRPSTFDLSAFPNPFNPTARIRYDLPKAGAVTLKMFDILGREVAVLVDKHMPAGSYSIEWNAESLPSGMYFAVLHAGDKRIVQKMLLLK